MAKAFREPDPKRYSAGNFAPAQAVPYQHAITAAAARVDLTIPSEAKRLAERSNQKVAAMQAAAWEYYDAIAEIKYALGMVASIVSRIRLYAAYVEDPAELPVPVQKSETIKPDLGDAAVRTLGRLNSAYGGQSGLLRDAALNLAVAGECYLVQIPETIGTNREESWDIRSTDELQVIVNKEAPELNKYVIYPRSELVHGTSTFSSSIIPEGAIVLNANEAFAGRIWKAHPRFSEDPDSSLFSMLELCDELLTLDRVFKATERSRLNAGLLYIPDALSSSASPDPSLFAEDDDPDPTAEDAADEFEEQLLIGMSTPIVDESSASAVVPIIIRGPADLADKVKHIKLERSFDDALIARGDRVLERIIQGLDVPKDTVTGLANVKYSNAIQIDEALYKAHIEPMIQMLADAFTVMFLRPALIKLGYTKDEVAKVVVWYDPSAVATRNDRAADADSGFEKGAISFDTWRKAHGFSDQDAPTQNEALFRKVMDSGVFTPELTEALLAVIAPEMMTAAKGAAQANSVAPIPGAAQDILSGGTGAPVDPTAQPMDPNAAPTDPNVDPNAVAPEAAPEAAAPAGPAVSPGEDAPPFPLAEPSGNAQEPEVDEEEPGVV